MLFGMMVTDTKKTIAFLAIVLIAVITTVDCEETVNVTEEENKRDNVTAGTIMNHYILKLQEISFVRCCINKKKLYPKCNNSWGVFFISHARIYKILILH